MITISTCTEPAPIMAQMPGVELPQTGYVEQAGYTEQDREPDETEGPGVFAKILAGLLGKTGNEAVIEADDQPQLAEFSELEADFKAQTGDESVAGWEKNHLFGKITQKNTGNIEKIAVKTGKNSEENELSGLEFSEEDLSILLGVELLLNRSGDQIVLNGDGVTAEDFSGTEGVSLLTGQTEEADFAAFQTLNAAFAAENAGFEETPVEKITVEDTSTEAAALSEAAKKTGQEETKGKFQNTGNIEAALADGQRNEEFAALRKNGSEKESRGKLDEARGKRRDRFTVDVRDFRTGESSSAQKSAEMRFNAGAENRLRSEPGTREITLELRLPDQGQNASTAETQWEAKAGRAVEDLLARELHQNFNGDIVRHASMALRDGGEGTIRLALKPESLGNVKIRLEMAENKITGQIVVESEEALRAFEREIRSLEQAFRDSGFESANLNLSLAADGRGADQFQQGTEAGPFLPQVAASRYDAAFDQAQTPAADASAFYGRGPSSINMLA